MKKTKHGYYRNGGLIFLALLTFSMSAFAQVLTDTTGLTRYTPDYKFREGIFLNFQQVRDNDPVPQSRILTNVDFNDRDFYTKVLENKTLIFYDKFGMKQEVRTDNIWGFSRNGIPYIAINKNYYRITIVGNICHFVATVTTYDTRYYDPYYYNPYDYYYRSGGYPMNSSSNEMRQYLLDFDSGRVLDYDFQSLEVLLMKDPELHDEYAQLRRKKKRQLKFLYLRKFNDRNPLYLPSN